MPSRKDASEFGLPDKHADPRSPRVSSLWPYKPDHVHVLADGQIVRSGGKELAFELEKHGYDFLKEEVVVAG